MLALIRGAGDIASGIALRLHRSGFQVVMTEIMGSREVNTYDIHTRDLAAKIPGSVWFDTFDTVAQYLYENVQSGDLVITLGCGDVYKIAKKLIKKYTEN